MFELVDGVNHGAVIKVIGVGGCGGNAVDHMVDRGIDGVEFICINTDAQALKGNKSRTAIQIGANVTKGLGAGANPDAGKEAALEDRDRLMDVIEGSDMLFITAGMGGGTGTGAAPVVAQVARELGVLTVAVVAKPFSLEGGKRTRIAEEGILELGKYCDSLITVPNEKLLAVLGPQTSLKDAFAAANQVLQGAVQGIAELITRPGMINVDFADVRTVMHETGQAMMGTGEGKGEHRAREAAETAISSPLLEDVDLAGANGILVNITAGENLTLGEFQEVGDAVKNIAADEATVVVGTAIDPEVGDSVRVTVVATGIGRQQAPELVQPVAPVARSVPRTPQRGAARPGAPVVSPVTNATGPADYRDYENPSVLRAQGRARPVAEEEAAGPRRSGDGELLQTLNVPAFLRRQAD